VIDDTACHRVAATLILKQIGFDVQEAIDGVQGLQMMTDNTFDVVVCDYEMPNMNGFQCVERLRHWEEADRPPRQRQHVVCFTATPGIEAQGLQAGMDRVVAKPYSVHKLEKALEQALQDRSMQLAA